MIITRENLETADSELVEDVLRLYLIFDKKEFDMQTIQYIPCESGGNGTSYQGKIMASYYDLVDMFGKPAFEGIGDKVTTEWVIDYQVSDGEGERKYGTFTPVSYTHLRAHET